MNDLYYCENSRFRDPHHKYLITPDLKTVESSKPRKVLTDDLNNGEPRNIYIYFSKAQIKLDQALENWLQKIVPRNKLDISTLSPSKEFVLSMLK